jgi:hypothetical protein
MKIIYLAGSNSHSHWDQVDFIKDTYLSKMLEVFDVFYVGNFQDATNDKLDNLKLIVKNIPTQTNGALATAAFGLSYISNDESFLLVPSNAIIPLTDLRKFSEKMLTTRARVGAVIFKSTDSRFSYARKDREDRLVEIVEKQVVGDSAFAGIYFFANKQDFSDCIQWSMVNNFQTNGQYYISPSLNYFLAMSIRIDLFEIESANYLRFDSKSEVILSIQRWSEIYG